ILAYMYHMIRKAQDNRLSIKRKDFEDAGKHVELFPGVETWFDRINAYGESLGVKIEHYIISSGLKEIIEGTKIKDAFEKIYACEFHYNENGVADWPALTVNYTNKTQFLFRINKGVLELYEDEKLNEFKEDRDRRIPFRNMIYIGDGLTDVPCMKLVKVNGGQSIAVYTEKHKVEKLLMDQRVDFITPANYEEGKELDYLVKTIVHKMAIVNELVDIHHEQSKT
ncbi:haloacid dehalogenase-like hydrolase, partial [Breznakia sp. OttesenSCG-928-G09]|nr:haloacid dehalogenase-like hydrolase [Breznakia sp. OttesenSCG-928-G09]